MNVVTDKRPSFFYNFLLLAWSKSRFYPIIYVEIFWFSSKTAKTLFKTLSLGKYKRSLGIRTKKTNV